MKDVLDGRDLQQGSQQQVARKALPVDATEARLLGVLGVEPVHIDEICAQLNLPIETVSATLAMMELKGMVRQVGGMNYLAARESRASYGDSE
jgi:DNA processing protein